jgi:hypothetical protein
MTLSAFARFLHVVHHGGSALRATVAVCTLVALWIVLKCIELALIPE